MVEQVDSILNFQQAALARHDSEVEGLVCGVLQRGVGAPKGLSEPTHASREVGEIEACDCDAECASENDHDRFDVEIGCGCAGKHDGAEHQEESETQPQESGGVDNASNGNLTN